MMKKLIKRVLCFASAAIVMAGTPALSAFAKEEKAEFELMQVVYSEPSEYGYTGYEYVTPGNEDIFESEMLFCASVDSSLPSSFDARELGVITETKSQGITNNCWAFSAISALETDAIMNGLTELENTDFAEAHLSWFSGRSLTSNESDLTNGDGVHKASPYYEGGNQKLATATLARHSGLANEADYPFFGTDFSKMGNYDENDRYDTSGGVVIESSQELRNEYDVKEWILEHGSVVVAFCYEDKYYHNNNTAYYYNNGTIPNHEVTIIGWDDDYPAENFNKNNRPAADGAWLCKNSWGEYWGMGGCFYLSYYDTSINSFTGYSARSAENINNNYTYNGTNWRTALVCNNAMEAANVFRAKDNEILSSVATYTATADTKLKISIYANLPENYQKPTLGTKVAEIQTTVHNTGYHTIYLVSPVELEKGSIFSVVIRYTSPSGIISVPFEKNGVNENSYASRKGESFINTNITRPNWYESSNYNMQNAYIQAITEKAKVCAHEFVASVITASTCTSYGTCADVCSLCGFSQNEASLPLADHTYGEWSEYIHNDETGRETSTRECTHCGSTSERSYVIGNSVPANDMFENIFRQIIEMFIQIIFKNFTL